jgi:hypothetical protein
MVLSWIEDSVSEYYRKTEHLVFNNVAYFATTPGKKQPAWQEFDILAVKQGKAKIVSCKRGLGPEDYDRQAKLLSFHGENLVKDPQLKIYKPLFSGSPELVLVIEYPRPKHKKRIEKTEIVVRPLDDLLREYINLLKGELEEHGGNEGKEENYATRLLKGLLKKEIIDVKLEKKTGA